MTTEQNKSPPKAHEVTPDMLIEMGRANNTQSAERLQKISRLEEINAQLLEACETALKDYEQHLPSATTVPGILHAAIAKARGQQ